MIACAHVLFDFHGKYMTLQLEGKLGASNGYLHFAPISGQLGSFPIPQSTLETSVQKMMDSPDYREKLKLPAEMSDLKIENGETVATYHYRPGRIRLPHPFLPKNQQLNT